MDLLAYTKFLVALLFVIALIALFGTIARRFRMFPSGTGPVSRRGRLGLIDQLSLDQKRKLVLIRRDDQEHLLLLGATGDRVIETDIAEEPIGDPDGGLAHHIPEEEDDDGLQPSPRIVSLTRYQK